MVDDDPELVIGEVDRALVFLPGSARIWTDEDDPFDPPELWGLNLIGIEEGTEDPRDPLDLVLLAPDQVADARHHDLARVDVIRMGGLQLQLAPRRSAQSCADVQAVSAVRRRSGFQQPSDAQPDLRDAGRTILGMAASHSIP